MSKGIQCHLHFCTFKNSIHLHIQHALWRRIPPRRVRTSEAKQTPLGIDGMTEIWLGYVSRCSPKKFFVKYTREIQVGAVLQ